jgi:hypothetical protein
MLRSTQRKDIRVAAQYQCDTGGLNVRDEHALNFIRHTEKLAVYHHGWIGRAIENALLRPHPISLDSAVPNDGMAMMQGGWDGQEADESEVR